MRKITILTVMICCGLFSFGQTTDEENIKKTIGAEEDAIFKKDFNAFAATWQHSPNATFSFFSRNGHNNIKGWDSLVAAMQRSFKNPGVNNTAGRTIDNYKIQTNGNMAWVEYDMKYPPSNGPFPLPGSHDYRTMVKENDQWKTVSYLVTQPESYSDTSRTIEQNLNTTGYDLLSQKKIDNAIEVFMLNVKFFPASWNTYDSLGEAYALAGNKKLAIENYEKSLKLNPKNESATEALVKLRK